MDVPKVCQCLMFKREGTCWHTGYAPPKVRRTLVDTEPIPTHERRRRDFLCLLKEQRPNDPDVEDTTG